eukprot:12417537-Karenia_brevis.AAC.1
MGRTQLCNLVTAAHTPACTLHNNNHAARTSHSFAIAFHPNKAPSQLADSVGVKLRLFRPHHPNQIQRT